MALNPNSFMELMRVFPSKVASIARLFLLCSLLNGAVCKRLNNK